MRYARWMLCATLCGGCGRWIEPEDHGSTVRYEPASPDLQPAPKAPRAGLPSAPATFLPERRRAVEVRQGGSVVRYEPILDAEPWGDPGSPGPPIEEEAEPHDAGDQELALEDRPSSRPPHESSHETAEVDRAIFGVQLTADGLAIPYPTAHMFRGFGRCRGRRHHHEAIDLGGVGPDWGLGTPIRSMARAEVLFIGTGLDDPADFGTPDKRSGEALRGDRLLPRSRDIPPYGRVYFFTARKGRWRSGNIVVTRALEGPLEGHIIRYLHLGSIHPDTQLGAVLERGQELGVMGGTGVQDSAPHVHIDILSPAQRRLDVAPLLGLAPTATCHAQGPDAPRTAVVEDAPRAPRIERSRLTEDLDTPPANDASSLRLANLSVGRCKRTARSEDFASGRYLAHTAELKLEKGQWVTLELLRTGGQWKPRLEVAGHGATIKTLASGKIGKKAVATVTAVDDGAVLVKVGAWGKGPPADAAYTLNVTGRCHRAGR